MYVKYFKFKGKPFGINPNPKFFFNSKTHKRALSCLGYGLGQGQGFVIITGDSGTGKSTLMSSMVHMLAETNIITASIINTQLQDDEMLRYVAAELDLPFEGLSKVSLLKSLEEFFAKCMRNDNRVIILIDEAQNISDPAIEELRMLMNLIKGDESVLQIVLFGQTSLQKHLSSEQFKSIKQRTVSSYELTNLGEEETKAYITLRLRAVGWIGEPEISPGAYLAIYENSQGIPAKINMICGKLLQAASVKETNFIVEEDVQNIDREMNHNFSDSAFSGSLVEGVVEAIMDQRMKALEASQSAQNNEVDVDTPDVISSEESKKEADVQVITAVEHIEEAVEVIENEVAEPEMSTTLEIDAIQMDVSDEVYSVEEISAEDKALEHDLELQFDTDERAMLEEDMKPKLDEPRLDLMTLETSEQETSIVLESDLAGTLELTAPEMIELEDTTDINEGVVHSDANSPVELADTFELESDTPSILGIDKATLKRVEENSDALVVTPDVEDIELTEIARPTESVQIVDELTADEIAIQKTIESLDVPEVDDLEVIGLGDREEEEIPMISDQISSEEAFMETSKLADSGDVDGEIQQWLQQKKSDFSGGGWSGSESQSENSSVDDFENTIEDQK